MATSASTPLLQPGGSGNTKLLPVIEKVYPDQIQLTISYWQCTIIVIAVLLALISMLFPEFLGTLSEVVSGAPKCIHIGKRLYCTF
jgi:hypothetical protein